MDAQDVRLALGISKRCLQNYRDNGLIPYSNVGGGEFFYREVDIQEILENGLIKRK
ncbi:MAG: helix-turn-helix domain-containing protein [Parabacteroides sp.]|nr:helix-turn-helix domain-containing protein [Parabacteroides sp.]